MKDLCVCVCMCTKSAWLPSRMPKEMLSTHTCTTHTRARSHSPPHMILSAVVVVVEAVTRSHTHTVITHGNEWMKEGKSASARAGLQPVESPSAADDTEAPSMPRDRTCSDHTIMMLPQTLIAGVGTVKWTLVYKLHQPIKMY